MMQWGKYSEWMKYVTKIHKHKIHKNISTAIKRNDGKKQNNTTHDKYNINNNR